MRRGVLMMRPQPRFFMPGTAARYRKTPTTGLMPMIRFPFLGRKLLDRRHDWIPALLTRTSTEPRCFRRGDHAAIPRLVHVGGE